MVTYTTTDLVNNIKNVAHIPVGNNTFTNAQLLSLGDMQMRTFLQPKIASCRENYWLTSKDYEENDDNAYAIPSKAQGSALVDMKIRQGNSYIDLIRVEVGDLVSDQYSPLPAYAYYIEDFKAKLLNNISGTRVIWYYRIPSKLVATSACAQITDVDGDEVTVSSLPSTFVGGGEVDIVSQQPGFNVLLKDSEPSIAGSVLTFDEDVPSDVQVGDYVCLSGQSCVIQAPLEWIEVLVQLITVKIYEIQGYDTKFKASKSVLDEMIENAMGLVSPRTVESPKVIMAGGSLLGVRGTSWFPARRN